ncbi:uncharacterized protein LOC141913156 [Tubulanus polymorphus]|uniref:uncharacterized protein LOC141913156 n=1 Tax=Tubulanus polymorphus TaxID=672921 RepID=UPI003DA40060
MSPSDSNYLEYLKGKNLPIVCGSCPGNTYYYKEENMAKMLAFADQNAEKVLVIIPTVPYIHNYIAVGRSKPEKIARKETRKLVTLAQKVMEDLDIDQKKFHFVDWKAEIETSVAYKNKLTEVLRLYETCSEFKQDAEILTKDVLMSIVQSLDRPSNSPVEVDTQEGVKFLLKELAFDMAIPEIYKGFEEYIDVYHEPGDKFFRSFYSGRYDGKVKTFRNEVVVN